MIADRTILAPRRHDAILAGVGDFETAARRLGIPTIHYVDKTTVSPVLTLNGAACAAIVLETPEPMDAALRMSITVSGAPANVIANLDETRLVLMPAGGSVWAASVLPVLISWKRDPGTVEEDRRGVTTPGQPTNLGPEIVSFDVDAGGV